MRDFRDIELEVEGESEEARVPQVFRNRGAPKKTEIEQPREEFGGLVFDYGFLEAQGEKEIVAIQFARDTRTKMLFVYVLPRQGPTHERGAEKIYQGHQEVGILGDDFEV